MKPAGFHRNAKRRTRGNRNFKAAGLQGTLRWRSVGAVLQLGVLFIALSRKTQTAIEKLVQQAQQFHLAVNFDRTMHGTLTLQECPEMFLDQHNRPTEIGKGNALRSATLTDLKI